MNRKYIDFVPVRPKKPSVNWDDIKSDRIANVEEYIEEKPEIVEEVYVEESFSTDTSGFSIKQEPVFGVVEDFRPKFVKTEVEKRPLHKSHFVANSGSLAEAKSIKVSDKKISGQKGKDNEEKTGKNPKDESEMKIPKTRFVNQVRVEKRPLSKNVYERKVEPTKETPTGPVTIISKPEKDNKAGLVITIILTIILGAAAGTVAFLILPK